MPSNDDLASEYTFDYKKAKPNRFAAEDKKRKIMVLFWMKMLIKSFLNPKLLIE